MFNAMQSLKTYIKQTLFLCILLISVQATAQITYPTNGVKDERSGHYAFTNATVYTNYNQKVENATLIIKDGKVVSVSPSTNVPTDAIEIDCEGKTIYPSFIELLSSYGIPDAKPVGEGRKGQQFLSDKKGAYYWNEAIKPEIHAKELFAADDKKAEGMRKLGFGTVVTHQRDGIVRGTGSLVALGGENENEALLKEKVANFYSFKKGVTKQSYPSSLMGSIALLRQAYLDTKWYENGGHKEEQNLSLQHWIDNKDLPVIFETNTWQDILRADKVGDEAGVQYIIRGGGDEYRRLDLLRQTNADLIIPVNFPDAYDVADPLDAHYLELTSMKHWELAPYNLARVAKANINFAVTTDGLKDKKPFLKHLKKAVKNGLDKETALKALTYNPAKMAGVSDKVGSLQNGKAANFIITSGDVFEKGKILENWILGHRYTIEKLDTRDLAGNYTLEFTDQKEPYQLQITGKPGKHDMNIVVNDTTKIKVTASFSDKRINLSFAPIGEDATGTIRLSGIMESDEWKGQGQNEEGEWIKWSVFGRTDLEKEDEKEEDKKKDEKKEKEDKDKKKEKEITDLTYPFTPYGWTEKPTPETVLFKNATVWTNTNDGILENADVLISNGKIRQVGKNLPSAGATVIDAKGKHITSGIIDEHSHIAISRGVNESAQASSAEVRIGDVVNSDDVNIYRQLAGGVTTAQLLHGSANPIGGQSAIIKFRWGSAPEQMKFEGAPGFIKFALGENVKQSNWGENTNTRFPQTRMGVEQVFLDHFTKAREYENGPKLRKDLELETLNEIINKKRFITCHSYIQSEITMLMRVAEEFNFNVNTFTHILEGYKVADKMKNHGVHASTFSDWWAYKFEVNDAIPYNAAILNEMGIVTAINSDDAEMGRRLNSEAAKGMKYGGMTEEEAWKMVTLNPAIILHLDNRVGSIQAGKDADIVLWSDNPLSVYTVAEQTYVDGIKYWDIEKDKELRKEISKERNRLIQKMLDEKNGGGKTQPVKVKEKHHFHCDDIEDFGNAEEENF